MHVCFDKFADGVTSNSLLSSPSSNRPCMQVLRGLNLVLSGMDKETRARMRETASAFGATVSQFVATSTTHVVSDGHTDKVRFCMCCMAVLLALLLSAALIGVRLKA